MTPEELAHLHAAANDRDRAWNTAEFGALLTSPGVKLWSKTGGFALTRTIAGEAELLTLAVVPEHRRKGIARGLVERWLATATPEAESAFLEVAEDNAGALRLYAALGFVQVGRRPRYYVRAQKEAVDALVLRLELSGSSCKDTTRSSA